MSAQTPVPKDHPMMKAWEEYKLTPEYANTLKWATHPEHAQGSLCAAFIRGFGAAGGAAQGAGGPVTSLPGEVVNALPEQARRYIMWLETEADPAGTIRENWRLTQENAALQKLVAEAGGEATGQQPAFPHITKWG